MTDLKNTEACQNYKAICYVDAGCKPNPGFYGCGMHGYVYNPENNGKKSSDKPSKYVISDTGYIEVEMLLKTPDHTPVIPDYYINGTTSFGNIGTNNVGEIMAMIITINKTIEFQNGKITELLLKADSSYAIHIFNTVVNDPEESWRYKVETNLEYYKLLYNAMIRARDNGLLVTVAKVEGHSMSLGNHLADRLATMGRVLSSKGQVKDVFHFTPTKKYWSSSVDRHTFLKFRQLYFTSVARQESKEIVYSIMNYKKDIEAGKRTHEATFGMVILNQAPELIENVINEYQMNLNTMSLVSSVDLDELYGQYHTNYVELFGNDVYTYSKNKPTLCLFDEVQIVESIHPQGLANQALEKMMVLYEILKEYRVRNEMPVSRLYVDISDYFYKHDGKKIETIIDRNNPRLLIPIEINGKTINIPIELGKDCLDRNQFKQIEKNNTKVTLSVKYVSESCFTYYIIVDMQETNDLSIWCNFYNNRVLIEQKKK